MTICQETEHFGEQKSMSSHDYVAHVRILCKTENIVLVSTTRNTDKTICLILE